MPLCEDEGDGVAGHWRECGDERIGYVPSRRSELDEGEV